MKILLLMIGNLKMRLKAFREKENNKVRDIIVSDIYKQCEEIVKDTVDKKIKIKY